MHATITEPGASAPVSTQAPADGITVGAYIFGTDVTLGTQRYGRVVEIAPPLKFSGQFGNRYRLVDTDHGSHWVDGAGLADPVRDSERAARRALEAPDAQPADAAAAALVAARRAGAGQHLAAKLARAAHDAAADQLAGAGRLDDHGITAADVAGA